MNGFQEITELEGKQILLLNYTIGDIVSGTKLIQA